MLKLLGGVFLIFLFLSCSESRIKESRASDNESEVLRELTKKIANAPQKAELYFDRGNIYRELKQDSLALVDFQKAATLDTLQAKYYSAIGNLLFEKKDISGSIEWLRKAVMLNPNDEVAHLKMATLFFYTKEYPKAFAEINNVLRTNVHNAEAYFIKGLIYKDMQDTAHAISSFQTAIQTEPKYYDALMQIGMLYEAKKDRLALQYYENAYRIDSSNMEPLYAQAMFFQNQEKYVEAKQVLKRALIRNQNYAYGHYNMGWILLQEDSTEKAHRSFDRAIKVKPDYFEAYYNRGLCNEILGKNEAAMEDYEQALVFSSDYSLAKTALARVKKKK